MQQQIPQLLGFMPARNVQDYEDILARLRGVPRVIGQVIDLLDKGLKEGITPPRITLRDVPAQVGNLLVDDPMKSPMLRAFQKFPAAIPAAEQERLKARGRQGLQRRDRSRRSASSRATSPTPTCRPPASRSP